MTDTEILKMLDGVKLTAIAHSKAMLLAIKALERISIDCQCETVDRNVCFDISTKALAEMREVLEGIEVKP